MKIKKNRCRIRRRFFLHYKNHKKQLLPWNALFFVFTFLLQYDRLKGVRGEPLVIYVRKESIL